MSTFTAVRFNEARKMYDGYVGNHVVSRAKTVKAVVRTLVKNYGATFIHTGPNERKEVIDARKVVLINI